MSTSTTSGARDHARAQAAGANARSVEPPVGIPVADLVWDDIVDGGRYAFRALPRGAHLRFTDTHGDAAVQLLLFNALAPHERLNVADTAKVQWQAYLGEGALLLTDMGRVMATIVADTSGHHDLFCGARTGPPATVGEPMPSTRSLLTLGAARFGLGRRDVHPCVNLLKGVRVTDGDRLELTGGAGPGAFVELRLELPVYVVAANTPHVLDERQPAVCTPLRITAWRGTCAGADDRWRNATPEAVRAFENTEDYLLAHPLAAAS